MIWQFYLTTEIFDVLSSPNATDEDANQNDENEQMEKINKYTNFKRLMNKLRYGPPKVHFRN